MSTYLEERLEWYDYNYRMGTPLISNDQFDQLEANLYRFNPKANYFTKKQYYLCHHYLKIVLKNL